MLSHLRHVHEHELTKRDEFQGVRGYINLVSILELLLNFLVFCRVWFPSFEMMMKGNVNFIDVKDINPFYSVITLCIVAYGGVVSGTSPHHTPYNNLYDHKNDPPKEAVSLSDLPTGFPSLQQQILQYQQAFRNPSLGNDEGIMRIR